MAAPCRQSWGSSSGGRGVRANSCPVQANFVDWCGFHRARIGVVSAALHPDRSAAMALWKEQQQVKPSPTPAPDALEMSSRFEPAAVEPQSAPATSPATAPARSKPMGESLIAPEIAIEGKIEGAGHVRIAGRFKGDVNVRGDLTIEPGAKVN